MSQIVRCVGLPALDAISLKDKSMVVHMQKCVLARQKMHKNDDKHFVCDPSPIAERVYLSPFKCDGFLSECILLFYAPT